MSGSANVPVPDPRAAIAEFSLTNDSRLSQLRQQEWRARCAGVVVVIMAAVIIGFPLLFWQSFVVFRPHGLLVQCLFSVFSAAGLWWIYHAVAYDSRVARELTHRLLVQDWLAHPDMPRTDWREVLGPKNDVHIELPRFLICINLFSLSDDRALTFDELYRFNSLLGNCKRIAITIGLSDAPKSLYQAWAAYLDQLRTNTAEISELVVAVQATQSWLEWVRLRSLKDDSEVVLRAIAWALPRMHSHVLEISDDLTGLRGAGFSDLFDKRFIAKAITQVAEEAEDVTVTGQEWANEGYRNARLYDVEYTVFSASSFRFMAERVLGHMDKDS
jgi:hypothetical protein